MELELKANHQHYKKFCHCCYINFFVKSPEKPKHRYPTRNNYIPNISKHSSTLFNNSFLCKSII